MPVTITFYKVSEHKPENGEEIIYLKPTQSFGYDGFEPRECSVEYVSLRSTHTPAVPEWQPIETAPSDKLVVVGWLDAEDQENPERHDFDYKEDGVWVKHEDLYQEFCCVAPPGSRGPKETAPYTHWLDVPPLDCKAMLAAAPTPKEES